MRTNPCCKYPNGHLTHFWNFHMWGFLVCCVLLFLCVARPPQRWGSWPMDPRLVTRGSNDLGGDMFKGEHVRVLLEQATFPFLMEVPPFLFDKRERKKARVKTYSSQKKQRLHQITWKGQDTRRKLHQRRALSSLHFVILFAFEFYLSSSKWGRLLRQHYQDLLMF